jgi:transcriptional regulator GlxA family with amidase domain
MAAVLRIFDLITHLEPEDLEERTADCEAKRVPRSLAFMRANPNQPLQICDMARQAGLSPSQFSRVFRRSTGSSPGRLLTRIRLERARELLIMTNIPMKELAASIGMRDAASIGRIFRAWHGVAPRDFRQFRHQP